MAKAAQKDVKNITEAINRIQGAKANAASEVVRSSKEQLSALVLITLGAALWVVSLLGLRSRFAGIIMEKKKEVGLMRALGARQTDIFRVVVTEALIVTFAGGAVGLLLGAYLLHTGVPAWTR